MSRQDNLKNLVSLHNRRLQTLEKQRLMKGPETPEHTLIEIDDIRAKVAGLQEELEEFEKGTARIPPPEIEGEYYTTKETLSEVRQILNDLSSETGYISPKAQGKVTHLLDGARQRFLELEKEWNSMNLQLESAGSTSGNSGNLQRFLKAVQALLGLKAKTQPPTKAALEALQSNLLTVKSSLKTLTTRRIHRRRLSLLREKLTSQQGILAEAQLKTTLEPQLRQIQEQIQALEGKENITPHEENLLRLNRRHLELSQQMMTGKRPYAPLHLWTEIITLEETLEELDNQIIEL